VAARRRRLEQCAEALRLQADGLSRAEVAARLGVGAETVKLLLRDGEFFGDPAGNPERARLTGLTSAAQGRGLTRAQFEGESGLSGNAAADPRALHPAALLSWLLAAVPCPDSLNLLSWVDVVGRGLSCR
jgi:transcriptional regulator with XRE-family HTH domain